MDQAVLDSLSPEELHRAMLALYDSLPASVWQSEGKPTPLRVQKTVERYAKELSADSLKVFNALQVSGNTSAKTATARWVLQKFYEEPAFAPLVEDAIVGSKQAHMSPIPPEAVYIGIALVTMAFRFRRTRTDDGSGKVASSSEWSFDPLTAVKEGLPVLAESLPRAIRSLFGAKNTSG
jgi:hypothetical protein